MAIGHASVDDADSLSSWTNRESAGAAPCVEGWETAVPEASERGTDDRGLAELATGGDESAYAAIFDRYARAVYRYAFALTRDGDDAEQLTEDAFLAAWRALADVRLMTRSLAPWLLSVCYAEHEGWLRGRRRRERALSDADLLLAAWSDEDDAQETFDWILDAVGELTTDDRRLCEACLLRGLRYRRAAASVGLSRRGAKRIRPIRAVPARGANTPRLEAS